MKALHLLRQVLLVCLLATAPTFSALAAQADASSTALHAQPTPANHDFQSNLAPPVEASPFSITVSQEGAAESHLQIAAFSPFASCTSIGTCPGAFPPPVQPISGCANLCLSTGCPAGQMCAVGYAGSNCYTCY